MCQSLLNEGNAHQLLEGNVEGSFEEVKNIYRETGLKAVVKS